MGVSFCEPECGSRQEAGLQGKSVCFLQGLQCPAQESSQALREKCWMQHVGNRCGRVLWWHKLCSGLLASGYSRIVVLTSDHKLACVGQATDMSQSHMLPPTMRPIPSLTSLSTKAQYLGSEFGSPPLC